MNYSAALDLLYLEWSPQGPVFADTDKILAGMEMAKANGFDCVEFWDWADKDADRIAAKREELDLTITSICAKDRGFLADPAQHEKSLESLAETIAAAKKLACRRVIVTAKELEGFDRKESHKNIVEGLKKLAALAEKEDIILVLEPIVFPDIEFFRDSSEAFAVIDEVGSENLKLLYDIFHFQLMEGNIEHALREHIDKIGHIHAAGLPGRTEISSGEINYKYLFGVIQELGYDQYIALEYMPTMDRESSLGACRSMFV